MLPVISWLHTTSILQWMLWEQPPGMNIFWISIKSMAIHWMMVRMLSSETPHHQRLKRTCPHHQFSDFSSSRSGLSSLLSCFSNHHEVDIVFPQGGTRCLSGSVCCHLLIVRTRMRGVVSVWVCSMMAPPTAYTLIISGWKLSACFFSVEGGELLWFCSSQSDTWSRVLGIQCWAGG